MWKYVESSLNKSIVPEHNRAQTIEDSMCNQARPSEGDILREACLLHIHGKRLCESHMYTYVHM